ncbi:MAG: crossover junction endodeoxyribonuclease RuvC [Chloroflexi bacterium]|nr:crossover junction endodeoxyribonuclease RuvC [Chloroflexota bacterium]
MPQIWCGAVLDRLILGIDPGLATLGYGLVKAGPKGIEYLDHGCVLTRPPTELPDRLAHLFHELRALRSSYPITDVAMESLFYAPRLRTRGLGEARGVAMVAVVTTGTQFFEYTPTQVKEAVTGSGGAGKRQVQEMVKLVLNLSAIPTPDDAADALAIALCHAREIDLQRLVATAEARQ